MFATMERQNSVPSKSNTSKSDSFASYAARIPRKQESAESKSSSTNKWKSDNRKAFSFDSDKSGKYGCIKSIK